MNDRWRRQKAEEKIAEWSVERGSFVAALERLVSEKRSAGEWTFEENEDVEKAIRFAQKFYDEYSHRIVQLSDGRCVYFVPDERAKARWDDIAFCWAEYAFHSVSSGGAKIPGKNYNFRKYNEYKVSNADLIESTLLAERCVPVLKDNRRMDSVKFFANAHLGGIFDVVVRLDDFGNANANLTEVTFEANSKRKQKNTPQLVSLAEAVRTVVSHQTATGTYPPNKNNITNSKLVRKGGGLEVLSGSTDIAVIILIGQEKMHLKRCIEKLAQLNPRQIFLVESQLDDGGVAIAKETAATLGLRLETMYHKWPGLYAEQFNWALENLPIAAEWVIRLDADEYFLPEAIDELKEKLPKLPKDVTGVINKRRHYIFGGWAKHGTYPVKLLRVFRRGKAFCEERYMDEHMQLREGRAVEFDYDFVDHNLNSFEWWKEKHRGYAKREAMDAMEIMAEIRSGKEKGIKIDGQAAGKRAKKYKYYQLPRYFRAVLYFCLRYFVKGGILDGRVGWKWNCWQGLWYRWIVDREIGRLQS